MKREEKKEKRIQRAQIRYQKNLDRNVPKLKKKKEYGKGLDCPYDVEMNFMFGTCTCNHRNYNECSGDI